MSNRKRKAKKSRAAGEQRRSHTDGAARARDKGEGRCWEPRRVGILLTLMIGCRGQPLGWRGVRVGEAANPGPYTEGGATGSGSGIRVGTWTEVGHGRWAKEGGGQDGYEDSGVDVAFAELDAWLDDRELGMVDEESVGCEAPSGGELTWGGERWQTSLPEDEEGGREEVVGGAGEGWRESERPWEGGPEVEHGGGGQTRPAGCGADAGGRGWMGGEKALGNGCLTRSARTC